MDDVLLAEALFQDVFAVVIDVNGFIAFDGAFHWRGICAQPAWHSLSEAWTGSHALHRLFSAIQPTDIPFAQDALGDQFVLRDELVWSLASETGELHPLGMDIQDFLAALGTSPRDFLPIGAIEQLKQEGRSLQPGELISAYPPFCSKESANGVSLRPVPAQERLRFLADFARQIAGVADGSVVRVVIDNDDDNA
jgi:hypothetical protein